MIQTSHEREGVFNLFHQVVCGVDYGSYRRFHGLGVDFVFFFFLLFALFGFVGRVEEGKGGVEERAEEVKQGFQKMLFLSLRGYVGIWEG